MDKFRVLLTSDIHCTDLEDWYGVRDEERMQRWLEDVLAEHARHPFDLILIPGDISLDFHAGRTPFDKGFSTSYLFMKMYASRLPAGVSVLVSPGNHDTFPEEIWQKIAGNGCQCHAVLGNHTFVMLHNFCGGETEDYDGCWRNIRRIMSGWYLIILIWSGSLKTSGNWWRRMTGSRACSWDIPTSIS